MKRRRTLTPSLPRFFTPSLPHSLTHSLTHSLAPSLTHTYATSVVATAAGSGVVEKAPCIVFYDSLGEPRLEHRGVIKRCAVAVTMVAWRVEGGM